MIRNSDTLAQVTKRLQTNLQTLYNQNAGIVGRSKKNGGFLSREGATVKTNQGNFAAVLDQAAKKNDTPEKSQATRKSEEFSEYTVQAGDTLWGLAVRKFHVNLKDLVSDNGIANPDLIKVGQKLKIRQTAKSQSPSQVVASWYGENFQGKPMANGSPYNMYANTIAHKDLPLGTKVELNNPRTGQTTTAVVTDRGPYVAGRDVDLSYGLARKLSLVEEGVDTLVMKVL
jgi:rare lipoprotein A